MPEVVFDEWIASNYARLWPHLFEPSVLDPAVDFLGELAGDRAALEFGVGTGRVAVALSRRGVLVDGIEISGPMAAQIPDDEGITVVVGDFATTRLDRRFGLVYLVRNTITNLTAQEAQLEAFRNAAAHLEPGGVFVIENYIPGLQRLPPGETTRVFARTDGHLAWEEYDSAAQLAVSNHRWLFDGEEVSFSSTHRYVWPAELDLMARLAGMTLRERYADWRRAPFTSDSANHISVWEKAAEPRQ